MVEASSKKVFYFTSFILPCLLLYIIFFITPFFRGIGISMTNWDGLTPKTPIILNKKDFESKILFNEKINQKDRLFLQEIYKYDSADDSYKRLSVGGKTRRKLERIVGKTGYQPEKNKFVGLQNYRKIFTGKIDKDFYPHTNIIKKFTKTSSLPGFFPEKTYKKEIVKNASKRKIDISLIQGAYEYNSNKGRYVLKPEFDEFILFNELWDLMDLEAGVSEPAVDSFIRELKDVTLSFDETLRELVIERFIKINKISEESKNIVYKVSDEFVKICHVKENLADVWVVKSRNMGVVGFTIFFAIFSVIGINVLAFGLALALDSGIHAQKILRTVFFLPNVLSMIIVALIWSMLFVQLLPAVTDVEKWLSDPNKTPWLLVLVAVWQGCGYYMIVYLAGLQNISTDVIEAAKIDGATGWQRFRYITLPLMIPSLTISLFLTIANALKSFDLIYAMIGQTGYATGTVPFVMDIYFDAFSLKEAGMATAKAMVLFFAIVCITGVQLYVMKRKEIEA